MVEILSERLVIFYSLAVGSRVISSAIVNLRGVSVFIIREERQVVIIHNFGIAVFLR